MVKEKTLTGIVTERENQKEYPLKSVPDTIKIDGMQGECSLLDRYKPGGEDYEQN